MTTVGFVGLGTMGGRIAKRLLDAGHTVVGYNRTPAKARWLTASGLRLAASPREVAEASEVTLSMVSDQAALAAVASGSEGIVAGLAPDALYADLSTVAPHASRALALEIGERGAVMLDAPVMGNAATLDRGLPLTVMVGGDADSFARLRPVLESAAHSVVFHIGAQGQALRLKAAFNLTLPAHLAALAEGLLIAEHAGIPLYVATAVFTTTGAASEALRTRLPFLTDLPEEPFFDCEAMQKDLRIALDLGRESGVPMPLTATVDQLLTTCRSLGWAKSDFAALYHALSHLAGSGPAD